MKILFIVPGSGDAFYCGNCFRDNLQVKALRDLGQEVIVMPLYLPLEQKEFQADTPLFFPATTLYAAQRLYKGAKIPGWLRWLTGSKWMLRLAASLSGTTSSEGLDGLTLSMIQGEDTAFGEMVRQMIDWIKEHERPDLIHLSSSLLIGIAKEIKRQVAIPIVCSLQDEEIWIDRLERGSADRAWQGIMENSRYVDHFVTTSCFYRDLILSRFPALGAVSVIYPGINRTLYQKSNEVDEPTIGFFYRMNEADGLDLLAEAFVKLKKENRVPGLRLRIGGGYTADDRRFVGRVKNLLRPYEQDVTWETDYNLRNHVDFYHQITVISVPIRFEESVGLYLCEAFASGCPAVEPSTGSFPEIVGDAGILYGENTSDRLADALASILTDPDLLAQCRSNAWDLSKKRYDHRVAAKRLLTLYRQVVGQDMILNDRT